MMKLLAFLVVVALSAALKAASLPDPLAASAAAQWSPMQGSPQADAATIGGQQALRMDCKFAGTHFDRASWDYQGKLDLSAVQGVRFRVWCDNTAPVSNFVVYFGSGDGWYRAGFSVNAEGAWSDVEIRKEQTAIEGIPAGWANVDRIRVSAWRGMDQDTTFYLAGFASAGEMPAVLVVRGDSLAKSRPGEAASTTEFAQSTMTLMREAGIECAAISDSECTDDVLQKAKLVVLPHNPQIPGPAAQAISAFLEHGGKLMSFYMLPEPLQGPSDIAGGQYRRESRPGEFSSIHADDSVLPGAPSEAKQHSWNIMDYRPVAGHGRVAATWYDADGNPTGVPAIILTDHAVCMSHVILPGDAPAKHELLLAMAGALVPDLWRDAATKQFESIGRIAGFATFEQAVDALTRASTLAGERAKAAAGLRVQAQALISNGKYSEAIHRAQESRAALLDAYYLAQTPVAGEHRAFWCHSAFGVAGMTWDQAIKELADNGFTAIFPNMLWGGVAFYNSDVLPVSPEVAKRGDQIAECLAACRKYGVECHVWKVDWNMGWATPSDFMQKMKAAGRTQVNYDGKPEDRWLCPSNPENQDLEIAAMVEVATKYDVDGIHFDYIRYPGPENCFCDGCRRRFEQRIGHPISDWPRAVRSDPQLAAAWNDFRQSNITRVVAEVSQKVRALGKKTKISAAVFSNYTTDRNSVGQDWKLWCDRGYLDFVCPMDYTSSIAEFRNLVTRQIQWAGKAQVYPGIGISTWPGGNRDTVKLIEMIKTTRQLGCKGFTVFEYNTAEAQEVVPALGKGITKPYPR